MTQVPTPQGTPPVASMAPSPGAETTAPGLAVPPQMPMAPSVGDSSTTPNIYPSTPAAGYGFVSPSSVVTEWVEKTNQIGEVTFPIFGGVTMTVVSGSELVFPWSGTDPDSSTVCYSYDSKAKKWFYPGTHAPDVARRRGPEHVGMYRMPGFKNATKTLELCTTFAGASPFNGLAPKAGARPTMPLKTYKSLVRDHMIKVGMWDVFCVEANGTRYDLFLNHSLFLLQDVQAHVSKLLALDDTLINENLTYSGQYIRNSIDADLLQAVVEECGINASGPVAFSTLMKVLQSDSFASVEKAKADLAKISLKSFAAENVEECAIAVETLCERLDCAGAFDMEHFCSMVRIFQGSTVEEFRLWVMEQSRKFQKLARELRVYSHQALGLQRVPRYEDFLRDVKMEYRNIRDSQEGWPPMVKAGRPSSQTDLSAFRAELRSVVKEELKYSGTPHKKGDDAKGKSKKKGDLTPSDTSSPGKVKFAFPKDPPKPGDEDKVVLVGKRKVRFCRTCVNKDGSKGRWCFHNTSGHDAWLQRRQVNGSPGGHRTRRGSPGTSTVPPPTTVSSGNPQANLAHVDGDDDWMVFGGLRAAFS